jgi:hypothetical protein
MSVQLLTVPALLIQQSNGYTLRPLIEIPTLHSHGQSAVEEEASSTGIGLAHVLTVAPGKIQPARVLDQQILPRAATLLTYSLTMGILDLSKAITRIGKKAIGPFKLSPFRKGLGQSASRLGGEAVTNIH